MTKKQYEKLKVGDVVSLRLGKNKGEKATVTFIYDDEEDRSEPLFGWVEVKFYNPDLYNSTLKSKIRENYKVHYEKKEDQTGYPRLRDLVVERQLKNESRM